MGKFDRYSPGAPTLNSEEPKIIFGQIGSARAVMTALAAV